MLYNVSILVLAFSIGSGAGGGRRGEADGAEVGSNSGQVDNHATAQIRGINKD